MIKPEPPKPPPMRVIKDDGLGLMVGAVMMLIPVCIIGMLAAKVLA